MDDDTLVTVFEDVIPVLREQPQRPQTDDSPQQRAIRSVWTAVDTTKMYLHRIVGEREERRPNPELGELWRDAAVRIAEFKPIP